jgi:hypothetical protein
LALVAAPLLLHLRIHQLNFLAATFSGFMKNVNTFRNNVNTSVLVLNTQLSNLPEQLMKKLNARLGPETQDIPVPLEQV